MSNKLEEMKLKEGNSGKKIVDLTGDGGVIKKILRKSTVRQKPKGGWDVTIHYTGKLSDGTVFYSTREKDEPFTYKLGTCTYIRL